MKSVTTLFFVFAVVCLAATAAGAPDALIPDAGVHPVHPAESTPDVPVSVDGVVDGVNGIVKAFESHHIRAGIAGIITLLVFVWRRFDKYVIAKIPSKWLPFIVAGVAFAAAIPQALVAEHWNWKTFVWQGLITGAEAMAFWSLLAKHVLKRFLPEDVKKG